MQGELTLSWSVQLRKIATKSPIIGGSVSNEAGLAVTHLTPFNPFVCSSVCSSVCPTKSTLGPKDPSVPATGARKMHPVEGLHF